MNVNGCVIVVGVLVADEPVEDLQQVGRTCGLRADGHTVNRVAAPAKRDARTSNVPEGAGQLAWMATPPLVNTLVINPEPGSKQGG